MTGGAVAATATSDNTSSTTNPSPPQPKASTSQTVAPQTIVVNPSPPPPKPAPKTIEGKPIVDNTILVSGGSVQPSDIAPTIKETVIKAPDLSTISLPNPNPSGPKDVIGEPIVAGKPYAVSVTPLRGAVTGKGIPSGASPGYIVNWSAPITEEQASMLRSLGSSNVKAGDLGSPIYVTGPPEQIYSNLIQQKQSQLNAEALLPPSKRTGSIVIPQAYEELVNMGYTILQPQDMPIDQSLAAIGQQIKANNGKLTNQIRTELGTSGLRLDEASKTISFPLYEKNVLTAAVNKARQDVIGPQMGGFAAGPSTSASEGKNFGQAALGIVSDQYSTEQQASIINALKTNPEYGASPTFNKGNINTENSPLLMAQSPTSKPDTSSLSSAPMVISGKKEIPAGLVFVPTQEAIDKANAARREQVNSMLLGNGLIDLSNQEITQRNQLIEQQNFNNKVDYALELLTYNDLKTKGVNRAGAGIEFEIPPGSEQNPISILGVKVSNPLLGGPLELFGEYVQNQIVSTQALLSSIPSRAKTVASEISDVLTHGIAAFNIPLLQQIYSPFTQEQAGIVASSSYEMPSLIGGIVKAGIGATKGKLDVSGFTSERGPAVALTGIGLDIATLLIPFERINPISVKGFKAVTEEGKVETIAREVTVGYGPLSKTVLSVAEHKPFLGEILPHLEQTKLSKIDVGESGLELTTQGKLGTKILTSEEGLNILQQAGKALPRDVEAALLSKEAAKLIQLSSEHVPNTIRVKAEEIPQTPLSTVKPGKESQTIVEVIVPKLQPIKGTLAETLQLEENLLNIRGAESNSPNIFDQLSVPQTPGELAAYNQVFGVNTAKAGESGLGALERPTIRNKTTGDIDVDYADAIFGVPRAVKMAKSAVTELNKVAEPGREFFKIKDTPAEKAVIDKLTGKVIKEAIPKRTGTNVLVKSEQNPKGETVLNILTKHDIEPGYLEEYAKKPFDIKLKGLVKVPVKAGSSKVGKFVTIEQNAMNRLESFITLHGPKSEKSMVQPPEYTKGVIQKSEKGYTVLPHEYRIKDAAKLISQDFEQISRNLKAVGLAKAGERLHEIKNKYIALYPEINFNIKGEKLTIEETHATSRFTSIVNAASSHLGNVPIRNLAIIKPEKTFIEKKPSPIKKTESKPSIIKESQSPIKNIEQLSKSSPLSPAKESPPKLESPVRTSPAKSTIKPESIINPSVSTPSPSRPSPLNPRSPSKSIIKPESPSRGSPFSPSPFSPLSPSKPSPQSPFSHSPLSSLTSGFRNSTTFNESLPKELPLVEFNQKTKPDQRKLLKKKERYNYLGNAPESQVVGLYNRIETIYGNVKIHKLVGKDFSMTTKGFPKLVTSKSSSYVTTKNVSLNPKKSKPNLKNKKPVLKL